MIFLSTVMDEETNTNNSVEHYDDHGGLEAASLVRTAYY